MEGKSDRRQSTCSSSSSSRAAQCTLNERIIVTWKLAMASVFAQRGSWQRGMRANDTGRRPPGTPLLTALDTTQRAVTR